MNAGFLFLAAALAQAPAAVEAVSGKAPLDAARALDAAAVSATPEDRPWVLLEAAERWRLTGDVARARAGFEAVVEGYAASAARGPASLGIAVVDAGARAGGNVLATLALIGDAEVPATLNAERYVLLAEARAGEGAALEEVRDLLARYRALGVADPGLAARASKLAPPVTPDKVPAEDRALAALRSALTRASWDEAAGLAADFKRTYPASIQQREVGYAARRAAQRVSLDARRVLVVLPLTGKLAAPAARVRDALVLGAGNDVVLDVVDTGGDPAACAAALETGVIERGASLVIGPFGKDEAAACAPVAQALRVPMVTLSTSAEGLAAGDHVFRGYPSVEQQVGALLDDAFNVRGLRRFAILHPTTSFGESAATAFEAGVVARGGTVAIKQSYAPGQKDYRAVAQALGRKDYKARASEFAAVRAAIRRAGGDETKASLPPVVDYDALFIPDTYQATALLASALAFEEFSVGAFQPRPDQPRVKLMGLAAWNNDDLARRGAAYVRGCMFVDAFQATSADPGVQRFVEAWRAGHGDAPGVMDAVGYDLGQFARAVAARGGGVEAVRTAHVESPVAGMSGFGLDRQAQRSFRILTVTAEGIAAMGPPEPVEPAPDAAAPR